MLGPSLLDEGSHTKRSDRPSLLMGSVCKPREMRPEVECYFERWLGFEKLVEILHDVAWACIYDDPVRFRAIKTFGRGLSIPVAGNRLKILLAGLELILTFGTEKRPELIATKYLNPSRVAVGVEMGECVA
jgi:hypothetical protein